MAGALPFLGIYFVLTIWILGFLEVFRKRLSCMAGMMAAMALGMTIGLGMGTLLAIWLPGQFFQATMLSMLIGGIVGTLAGLPISIMAVLDGLLAGIMGGMMGAMLTVMIPSAYIDPTLKIITVLCSGIIFLLFLMLQGEIKAEHLIHRSFLLSKPISMFAIIGIFLMIIHQTSGASSSQSEDHSAHSQLPQGETISCLQPECNAEVKTPETRQQLEQIPKQQTYVPRKNELLIKAEEFSFNPSSLRIAANEKIRITLDNTGDVEHDFEIIGTNIHVHAGPGKKSVTMATIEKSGTYKAVCTLPGHKEAGMISIVQVVL